MVIVSSRCGTGMGNSLPARKLASCPLKVTSVGFARIFTRPSSLRAPIKLVKVTPPVCRRNRALIAEPMVVAKFQSRQSVDLTDAKCCSPGLYRKIEAQPLGD